MNHEPRLDSEIHALTRLRLCSFLRPVDSADFRAITSALGVSDANLSKTIRILTEIGYVAVVKGPSADREDLRRTTTVKLTELGQSAFDGHIAALHEIVARSEPAARANEAQLGRTSRFVSDLNPGQRRSPEENGSHRGLSRA